VVLASFQPRAFGSESLYLFAFLVKPMWSLNYMGNNVKTGKVFESGKKENAI